MARYIRDFTINAAPQEIHAVINQYLQNEGYEYIKYDGETVFKKGKGILTSPSFFKFSYSGNMVRMETWMKCAIFPGVYVGEFSLNGFIGFAVKGVWQGRTAQIESILRRYSMVGGINMFCQQCGNQIREGVTFCPNCGTRQVKVNPNAASQNNQTSYGGNVAGQYAQQQYNQQQYNQQNGQYAQQQYNQQGYAGGGYAQPNPNAWGNTSGSPKYVSFGEAIKLYFVNYVNFEGRSTRSEYWWAFLFNTCVNILIELLIIFQIPVLALLAPIVSLGLLLPGLSIAIRRLHDTGKSWVYILMGLIPLAGPIILIVQYCKESDADNMWGPAPRN